MKSRAIITSKTLRRIFTACVIVFGVLSRMLAAPLGENVSAAEAKGDSQVLVDLVSEYNAPLPEGVIDEAAEMAQKNYKIDYRATVAKAATGDEGELANLFAIGLDGAAAESHAEVLYRLRRGLGHQVFHTRLSKQAPINQNRVNEMIAPYRENMGESETVKPSSRIPKRVIKTDPENFLGNGNFEGDLQLERGSGSLVKDSAVLGNQVLAFTSDDYLERPMSIPGDVNDITISLRVMIPSSIRLENLEPGKPASGVKIRVRNIGGKGNSGIAEWIVKPSESWQKLTTTLKNIGASRERLSLEASWFEGRIYFDDIKVTSLFPEFLPEGMYEHYQTPAQVTYIYVINLISNGGNGTKTSSPIIKDDKVTVAIDFSGQTETLWFVEKGNNGEKAKVVVGLPNAGGDLYHLEKIAGRWAITGIDESDGI